MNLKTQNFADQKYLSKLKNVDFKPIFIMGDHRSGTTILYQTLIATEYFNFVKAYHIIKYQEILTNYLENKQELVLQSLTKQFQSLGIKDRVFDTVIVTPNLPEEYGFILRNGGYEPYLNPENIALFQELSQKIQFISDQDKPLLLKNPWCFPHFDYIKNVLPEAKFIFLHRHPIHVINSKLKAVRTTLSEWNDYTALISRRYKQIFNNPLRLMFYRTMYSPYFNLGVNRVIKQSLKSTNYFLDHIDKISPQDYINIKYEDFCEQPELTIQKILNFLKLGTNIKLDYTSLIKPRPIKLLPEVAQQYNQIKYILEPYFLNQDYQ